MRGAGGGFEMIPDGLTWTEMDFMGLSIAVDVSWMIQAPGRPTAMGFRHSILEIDARGGKLGLHS